jgi:phosphoribosylanthranilate isomerase
MATRVKICGITSERDAASAIEAGADALGFVFYEKSPRFVTREIARDIIAKVPPFITTVGVFVNETADVIKGLREFVPLDRVQLHGDEPPEFSELLGPGVIKALRIKGEEDILVLKDYNATAFLLDAFVDGKPGGTGATFDWAIALEAKRYGRIILSGGLTPENVAEAVVRAAPYAVDVSSGVESSPGVKDPDKIRRFIEEAKGY